jgi:membrane-associated phospholipid phosphatase
MIFLSALKAADIALFKFLNITLYSETLAFLMRFTANDLFLIFLLAAGFLAFFIYFGKPEKTCTAFALWSIIIANFISGAVLKNVFKRPRPYLMVPGARLMVVMHRNGYAFPSTHTAMTAAFAAVLWDDYPDLRPYLSAIVVLVGFFCVYTGGHYPSDVAAGLVLGIVTGRSMYFMKKLYLKNITLK